MTLRIRGGAGETSGPPPTATYGPSNPANVRAQAGPRLVAEPVAPHTTLSSANSVGVNQGKITDDTYGVIWFQAGDYVLQSTGFSIPASKKCYLATGPLRDSRDTAVLTMSSTASTVVTITGANVEWHGGIVHGGGYGIRTPNGAADNAIIEDAEFRYAYEECFALGGASDNSNDVLNLRVSHCLMHHGGRHNAHPNYIDGLVWEYNHSHHGNDRHLEHPTPNDVSGVKAVVVSGITWRYNWEHETDGPAVWWDTWCTGTFTESIVENSYGVGFFIEDNDGVTVSKSLFSDCAKTSSSGAWTYGPYMSNMNISRSTHTDVSYCDFVTTNATTYDYDADIQLRYQTGGVYTLHDNYIHHNRFKRWKASGANRGFISHYNSNAEVAYTTKNNLYDYNEYHVPAGQGSSTWFNRAGDGDRTWTQWRAGGSGLYAPASYYDPNGSLTADL